MRRSLPRAIEIGELLYHKKKLVGQGNWLKWLEEHLEKPGIMSVKTAERYKKVFEHKDEIDTMSNLTEAYCYLILPGDMHPDVERALKKNGQKADDVLSAGNKGREKNKKKLHRKIIMREQRVALSLSNQTASRLLN